MVEVTINFATLSKSKKVGIRQEFIFWTRQKVIQLENVRSIEFAKN